jgi:hypothetical protein
MLVPFVASPQLFPFDTQSFRTRIDVIVVTASYRTSFEVI